jgi:hypothetical protein
MYIHFKKKTVVPSGHKGRSPKTVGADDRLKLHVFGVLSHSTQHKHLFWSVEKEFETGCCCLLVCLFVCLFFYIFFQL